MTNESDGQLQYRVSALGRIIYCFLALVFAGPFGSATLYAWWHDNQASLFMRILGLPFGLATVYMATYWLLRAFSPGLRFVIMEDSFTYYGLFSKTHLTWSTIQSFSLSYSRLGPVLMHLRLKEGRWPQNRKVLDLSGLKPSFRQLIATFEHHLKIPSAK